MGIQDHFFNHSNIYAISYPTDEQFSALCCAESCGKLWANSSYITDREDYDKLLFVYVEQGEMFLEFEGVRQIVREGSAFFLDCRPHQIYGTEGESCVLTFLHIVGGACDYFYRQIKDKRGYVLSGRYGQIIKKAIDDVMITSTFHLQNKTEMLSFIVTKAFYDLITIEPKADPLFEDAVGRIKAAVYAGQQVSVKDLADLVGYSKYYFTRKFTQQYGLSPYEFILSERMELVKSRLINTLDAVGDIALESGFFDASHMSNCFKKRESITPFEFRRKWKRTI